MTRAPTATEPVAPPEDVALAVVGDSISHADSAAFPEQVGERSWVRYATGDGVRLAGGWAQNGATTVDMAGGVLPVEADVLVVLAGTNDFGTGLPFETTAANLRQIVATVGAPRVIVSAVPPRDEFADRAVAFNGALQELATAAGWEFADPMGAIRQGDVFAPGMTDDGVHPSLPAARIIGAALRGWITAQP